MAKNLFISGNYIIAIDGNNYQREFPTGKTVYNQRNDIFTIQEGQIEGQEITIDVSDIVNWTDEFGFPYSEESFLKFIRGNTGASGPAFIRIDEPIFGDGTAKG